MSGNEPAIFHLGAEEGGFDVEAGEDGFIADLGGVEGEKMAEAGRGLGEWEERIGVWQEGDDAEEQFGWDTSQGGRGGEGSARDQHRATGTK